jgi:hypothetical protein
MSGLAVVKAPQDIGLQNSYQPKRFTEAIPDLGRR